MPPLTRQVCSPIESQDKTGGQRFSEPPSGLTTTRLRPNVLRMVLPEAAHRRVVIVSNGDQAQFGIDDHDARR